MTIGKYVAEFVANMDGFLGPIKQADRDAAALEKRMKPLRDAIQDTGTAMTGIGVAISAVGVPFGIMAKNAIDTADNLRDMAQSTGSTVEALSALSMQAEMSGATIDSVEVAMKKMNVTLQNAEEGNKTAAESLSKIGLSAKELLDMKPDERFFAVAAGLAAIEDPSLKAGVAVEILGKSGADLIPMLNDMAGGQEAVMESARAMGRVISTETGNAADAFNDSLTRLSSSVTGVFNAIVASGFLDSITELVNRVASVTAEFVKAHPGITAVGAAVGATALVLGPLIAGFGLMLTGIAGVIPLVISLGSLLAPAGAVAAGATGVTGALGAVAAILTGPVGVGIAIAAVVTALGVFAMKNETVRNAVASAWDSIKSSVGGVLDAIKVLFDATSAIWLTVWSVWGDSLKAVFGGLWTAVQGIFSSAWGLISGVVNAALAVIKGAIEVFTGILTLNWTTFTTGLKNIWSGLWDGLKSIIVAPIEAIKSTVGGFTSAVSGFFSNLFDDLVGHSVVPDLMDRIKEEFGKLGTIMKDPAQNATNAVLSSFETMLNGIITKLSTKIPVIGGLVGDLLNGALGQAFGNGGSGGPQLGGPNLQAFTNEPYFGLSGHSLTNKFNQTIQDPFQAGVGLIHDAFYAARSAGTLTIDSAKQFRAQLIALWNQYQSNTQAFARRNEESAGIVKRAIDRIGEVWGTDLSVITGGMDLVIASFQQANTAAESLAIATGKTAGGFDDLAVAAGGASITSAKTAFTALAEQMRTAVENMRSAFSGGDAPVIDEIASGRALPGKSAIGPVRPPGMSDAQWADYQINRRQLPGGARQPNINSYAMSAADEPHEPIVINVNVNGNVIGIDNLAREMAKAMPRIIKNEGFGTWSTLSR